MLIKEVERINKPAVNLLDQDSSVDVIDEIVELPLRKACKIFRDKGIETVMSSANQNNLLKPGEKRIEKEDIEKRSSLFETHTFLEAGCGYAWIMINFRTLSNENKDLLLSLESKGESYGRAIWFVHPFPMDDNIEYSLRTGKYGYDELKEILSEDEIPKGIKVDPYSVEFEKRHIVLMYPWIDSPEAVFLRMPLHDQSTVEEVEAYFASFAKRFFSQIKEKSLEDSKPTF